MRDSDSGTTRWIRAGAITSLIAVAFQETVEFSLQMPGNAALFAVVCAIALHRPPASAAARAPGQDPRRGRTLLRVVRGAGRQQT
jgi:hypothetical protein